MFNLDNSCFTNPKWSSPKSKCCVRTYVRSWRPLLFCFQKCSWYSVWNGQLLSQSLAVLHSWLVLAWVTQLLVCQFCTIEGRIPTREKARIPTREKARVSPFEWLAPYVGDTAFIFMSVVVFLLCLLDYMFQSLTEYCFGSPLKSEFVQL